MNASNFCGCERNCRAAAEGERGGREGAPEGQLSPTGSGIFKRDKGHNGLEIVSLRVEPRECLQLACKSPNGAYRKVQQWKRNQQES